LKVLRRSVQRTGDERVLYTSHGAQIARIEPTVNKPNRQGGKA
jgi:hypothetical protein